MRRTFVAASVALALLAGGASDAAPRPRREKRTYAGVGYLNPGLAVPGVLVDCNRGVTCVSVDLDPRERWAEFVVSDVTGHSVGGWALGWTAENGWWTLAEFCGASSGPVNVANQERLVIAFAAGQRCAPEGYTATAGEVSFRISR